MIEPNGLEHELTEAILYGMSSSEVARQLAAVREGATLEGPREFVSGTAMVPRRVAEGPGGQEVLERAVEHAWRSWFRELRRQRLRPCGWPAEDLRKVRGPRPVAGETTYIELDDDATDHECLIVSVTCEAVPAT